MLQVLLVSSITLGLAEPVKNWSASLVTPSEPESYKVVFEWEHQPSEAVVIATKNPLADPRCSGSSDEVASDGQPYWMPRFYPRPVSSEITAQTGIHFASVDWQPCGHKDIQICHGESHYDFHLYYVPEAELQAMQMCSIGTQANPKLPVCLDSPNPTNAAYFNLISHNMPVSAKLSAVGSSTKTDKNFTFCVDDSSAILRSGVHYGDKDETLKEWQTPVTIIGSHDCRMMFFEPMISWKWISGEHKASSYWPSHQVSDIRYNEKAFEALPHAWAITVSEGCERADTDTCRIQITVEGSKCPPAGCTLKRECGSMISCATNAMYQRSSSSTVPTSSYLFFAVPGMLILHALGSGAQRYL